MIVGRERADAERVRRERDAVGEEEREGEPHGTGHAPIVNNRRAVGRHG
jgi:hypothetical protein